MLLLKVQYTGCLFCDRVVVNQFYSILKSSANDRETVEVPTVLSNSETAFEVQLPLEAELCMMVHVD